MSVCVCRGGGGGCCAFDLTPQIQLWPNQIPVRLTSELVKVVLSRLENRGTTDPVMRSERSPRGLEEGEGGRGGGGGLDDDLIGG